MFFPFQEDRERIPIEWPPGSNVGGAPRGSLYVVYVWCMLEMMPHAVSE